MGFSRWWQRRLGGAGQWLLLRAGEGAWRDRGGTGTLVRWRVRPVFFGSMNALADLCTELERLWPSAKAEIRCDGLEQAPEHRLTVEDLAHRSELDRRNFELFLQSDVSGTDLNMSAAWSIVFRSEPGYPRIEFFNNLSLSRALSPQVESLIDEYSRPRRAGRVGAEWSVIRPVDLETELQQEHDAVVSRRASRQAALWGTGFGTLAGLFGSWLFELLP